MTPKILVVEDNDKNRYLVTFLLRADGFDVVEAVDGRRALEAALRDLPDLILLDIQMPEMDGYETAGRLKADARTRGIPIVGISSFAMAGDREKALGHGFVGYLEKPISPETFTRRIRSYLQPSKVVTP
jgi:CheY-like chemotaxis protein